MEGLTRSLISKSIESGGKRPLRVVIILAFVGVAASSLPINRAGGGVDTVHIPVAGVQTPTIMLCDQLELTRDVSLTETPEMRFARLRCPVNLAPDGTINHRPPRYHRIKR